MNILVLCHDIPSPTFSDTLPVYHLVKCLHAKHNHKINIICFDCGNTEVDKTIEDFIIGDPIKFNVNNLFQSFAVTLVNMFRFTNLRYKIKSKILPNLLDYYYSPEMNKKIRYSLKKENYDLIYLTRPMASYVLDLNVPKIIQPYDAVYKWHEQIYESSKGFKKIVYKILYLMTKYYENNVYNKFNTGFVVTDQDKELLKYLNPNLNLIVIPNGVNLDYFKPIGKEDDVPSLIYVSDMSGSPTTENVLHFYNDIFPLIKEKVPDVKLYLVGRNPAKEIEELSSDPSVLVTGYVEDVRPYLSKSWVFVAPMIMGTGIKNKVLEAMSMGKSVVSTKIGAQGIQAFPDKDLFVTDIDELFAEYVVNLLLDRTLRETMGNNARKVMEKKYSWIKISEKVNKIFLSFYEK